jgi:3-(3-hydroxy-phenyl)propionate hydroxylase
VKLADGSYLTDRVSAQFALLVFGSHQLDLAALASLTPAVRVHLVTEPRAAAAYDAVNGSAYLVRPDGHVCARWKAASLDKVRSALARATARSTT